MASTEKPEDYSGKTAPENKKPSGPLSLNLYFIDLSLRLLLFATTVVAIAVMVSSEETKSIIGLFPFPIRRAAKFNYSPALIYFVVALSVACLYSILSICASIFAILKPPPSDLLLLLLAFLDALMVGVCASATGAGASIAYVGLKGNSHVRWMKICNIYSKFCRHAVSSITMSLVASIILVLLVLLSAFALYRRIR